MADYQLTQTGNEVQALLNDIPNGKFTWLTSINTSLYDEIPQAQAEWFMGWYDPNWTNRPTDYGMIFRTTPNSASIPWSAEVAIAVGGEKGQIFVRATENGDPWSAWKRVSKRFATRSTSVSVNKAHGSSVSITAPSVSGYTFLHWIGCSTGGWVGGTYIENMISANTKIWVCASTESSGTGNVNAWALYVEN